MLHRFVLATAASLALLGVHPVLGASQAASAACPQDDLLALVDPLPDVASACPVPVGVVLAESAYFQNASRIGQSALAGYPMLSLDAGLPGRAGLTFDAPSQLAESGPRGAGLYPATAPGFGLSYALADGRRLALALRLADRPPLSPFATSTHQAEYALDETSLYRLSRAISLNASLGDADVHARAGDRLVPKADVGVGYDAGAATQITTDVGTGAPARRERAQAFGELSIKHALHERVGFETGLGTTFNPVSNAKAHYVSAGLDYKN